MRVTLLALMGLILLPLAAFSQLEWRATTEDTTEIFRWIDCVDSMNCLIVGTPLLSSDLSVLKTTDGGRTFQRFIVPEEDIYLGLPERISYPSIDTAYFLAEHGQVYRSINGGISWEVASVIRDLPLRHYTPIYFRTPQKAIVAVLGLSETADSVDMIYRTSDGARTWVSEFLPSPPGDSAIFPASICESEEGRISVIWYGIQTARHYFSTKAQGSDQWEHVEFPDSKGTLFDFVCVSESTYYVTYLVKKPLLPRGQYAYSVILKSVDFGKTWDTVFDGLSRDTTAIADLAFQDSLTALATSDVGVFRTTDGGSTWTIERFDPPTRYPSRVAASFPHGSDGIILTYDFNGSFVYLPDDVGGLTEQPIRQAQIRNVRIVPSRPGGGHVLAFDCPTSTNIKLQLYDIVGSNMFSAEYVARQGSNSIALDLPLHGHRVGFLRILSDGSAITLPIIL